MEYLFSQLNKSKMNKNSNAKIKKGNCEINQTIRNSYNSKNHGKLLVISK